MNSRILMYLLIGVFFSLFAYGVALPMSNMVAAVEIEIISDLSSDTYIVPEESPDVIQNDNNKNKDYSTEGIDSESIDVWYYALLAIIPSTLLAVFFSFLIEDHIEQKKQRRESNRIINMYLNQDLSNVSGESASQNPDLIIEADPIPKKEQDPHEDTTQIRSRFAIIAQNMSTIEEEA